MRDYLPHRNQERPRLSLRRGADGRLRAAGGEPDIGDLWAEQRRIRLHEDIAWDKKQAEKKQRSRGWSFVKRRAKPMPVPGKPAEPIRPARKEIAVTIQFPKVQLPTAHLKKGFAKILRRPHALPGKKPVRVAVFGAVLLAGIIAGWVVLGGSDKAAPDKTIAQKAQTLGAGTDDLPRNQEPDFTTFVPAGKDIASLGGWTRISPPDKDPVFAYADQLSGVPITVSQQPQPGSFKGDPAAVAKLAEQFAANEKVSVGELTVYIGTSAKGPQSVIVVKDEILMLIKSTARIPNEQWAAYITTLR